MNKNISFLLGSGFSIPDGVLGVREINQRLKKIDESEILIHSDMRAIFLNGQKDPNRFMNWDERQFVQEFLNFYSEHVLKPGDEFHYETFYDYYSDYLRGRGNQKEIDSFVEEFNKKIASGEAQIEKNAGTRLDAFNRSFNQLLSELIHSRKYFNDVGMANYVVYDPFIRFLKRILVNHDVKVHSLNHDLLFEYFGKNHSDLFKYFSDGFELEGSPFYGAVSITYDRGTEREVSKDYKVKLPRFTNFFNTKLALFKLHGSIMSYKVHRVYSSEPEGRDTVRIKGDYGVRKYFEEYEDSKTKKLKMEYLWDEPDPDFLSGTTEKTRRYSEPYYKLLFEHFEKNLTNAEILVVIGYGFKDPIINEYIEKHFLPNGGKMFVIGRSNPDSKLLEKYNAAFYDGSGHGLTGLTPENYSEILSEIGVQT